MFNTSGFAVFQLIADAGPVAKAVLLVLSLFSVVESPNGTVLFAGA